MPVSITSRTRAVSGAADTVDERALYDGGDVMIQRRAVDDVGEIAVETHVYNTRGLLMSGYAAWRPPSRAYAVPPDSVAHAVLTYDALGRPLSRRNPDGAVRRWSYGALSVTETDERGKATTKATDGTGHVTSVAQQFGMRTLTSSSEYDLKGNLVVHTDAAGNQVRTWFDALGRILRVRRPEHVIPLGVLSTQMIEDHLVGHRKERTVGVTQRAVERVRLRRAPAASATARTCPSPSVNVVTSCE